MNARLLFTFLFILLATGADTVFAQEDAQDLAATLEVLAPGVEVQRVNTGNWITVNTESIVGVGDTIRTNETGQARITFFQDGTDTELLPNTTFRIATFNGTTNLFHISVEVILGQTLQRLGRLFDSSSSYDVDTPGMKLGARGTRFAIRVEENGRSAMLVTEGLVNAAGQESGADVPPEFGVRAEVDSALSDVVRARTFDELDAALDGCTVAIKKQDDTRLNVRTGPGLDFPRIGTIDPVEIDRFYGILESGGWYRILFRGGFGWVLSSTAELQRGCAGLRQFAADFGTEDVSLYEELGETITLEELSDPQPEATPEATSAP